MKKIRSFTLVVVSLVWDLWVGNSRKAEYYDNHTMTRTKTGYFVYITLSAAIAISIVNWAYLRLK